jgi:flavodoxin I
MSKDSIICYLSYGGNTKEVAELIQNSLINNGYSAKLYRIGDGEIPHLSSYDIVFVGTFTWGKGGVPKDFKDFILKIGYKPNNVAVFGTGDTQFGGDDLFCNATNKLAKFYNSRYEILKIEQSPRGHQETIVLEWTEGVIKKWKDLN